MQDLEPKYRALEEELRRLHRLSEGDASYPALLDATVGELRKITTSSAGRTALLALKTACMASRRRGRKIKVQPTSLARRRPGLTRGAGRIAPGRPTNGKIRKAKRVHMLSHSIQLNVPGAK